MNSPTSNESGEYMLHIPENILNQIHDDIRNDEDRLRGHLIRAIKIGLLSIEGGEFTLSTDKIQSVLNNTADTMTEKYGEFDRNFTSSLDDLIKTKLTGNES
ncbi:uncharacterized protein METZ01_LOCUS451865, partial [marine metagenome]